MNSGFSRSNQSLENLPGKQDCQPIKHAPRHASLWASVSLIWCSLQKDEAKFSERETQKLWEIKKSWPQDRKQQRLWLFLAWVRLKWNTTRCTFTGRVQATSCCWRWMWSWCINYNLERWGFSPVFSFISLPPSTTSFQDWQKKLLKKTCSFLSQCLQIHMLKSPTLLQ